jgi:hypothetical protein
MQKQRQPFYNIRKAAAAFLYVEHGSYKQHIDSAEIGPRERVLSQGSAQFCGMMDDEANAEASDKMCCPLKIFDIATYEDAIIHWGNTESAFKVK